jgi:hypothetical protein
MGGSGGALKRRRRWKLLVCKRLPAADILVMIPKAKDFIDRRRRHDQVTSIRRHSRHPGHAPKHY